MKYIFTHFFLLLSFVTVSSFASAQDSTKRDTFPPDVRNYYNAGFDVIIKRNGDIIYGLVKEVDLHLIKYQRTDIPDGPVYTIRRDEVYAISYRNQVKDILNPWIDTSYNQKYNQYQRDSLSSLKSPYLPYSRDGMVHIGVGFFRSFSKVDNADQYNSSGTFPVISVAYDFFYKNNIRLGAQLASGSHKFSRQDYSSYDSTSTDINLKENIYTLYVYGKYVLADMRTYNFIEPYILAGLGINGSFIRKEQTLKFVDEPDQALLIKSGSRAFSLGVIARVGTDVHVSDMITIFADAGIGASILNLGVGVNIR